MKKIIYILLLAFVVSVAFTACTEEEIKPKSELEGLGGNGSDPIRR